MHGKHYHFMSIFHHLEMSLYFTGSTQNHLSIFTISNTRIIDKVKELIENGIIIKLVLDFAKLRTYSSGEEILYPTRRLSLIGKLRIALFDMVPMNFNREFKR